MTGKNLRNPVLQELEFLIGPWETKLSHASFLPVPGQTAIGRCEFELIEDGSLLVMRQFMDPDGLPAARWVIGGDDSMTDYTVLYADARGVSRVYHMSFEEDVWRMWREDPAFSQRFEARLTEGRARIAGAWEKRYAGGEWEHDFDVDFVRVS